MESFKSDQTAKAILKKMNKAGGIMPSDCMYN